MEDLDDKEFNELIKEKRFNEVILILNKILKNLGNIDKNLLSSFVDKTSLNKTDNTDFNKSIELIGLNITKSLENMKNNQQQEWLFNIQRDERGYIESIKAKEN
jgi:hypothetical protein